MGIIIIVIGIFICLFSLAVMVFSKRKGGSGVSDYGINELELEFRDLKNEILELTREFNRTAIYNTNILDEKIAYVSEIREDVDDKVLKLTKLMTDIEIKYGRIEKAVKGSTSNIGSFENILKNIEEPLTKSQPKKEVQQIPKDEKLKTDISGIIKKMKIEEAAGNETKKSENDDIMDMFEMGMTTMEISMKTGKAMGEIEFIIGLMKKR